MLLVQHLLSDHLLFLSLVFLLVVGRAHPLLGQTLNSMSRSHRQYHTEHRSIHLDPVQEEATVMVLVELKVATDAQLTTTALPKPPQLPLLGREVHQDVHLRLSPWQQKRFKRLDLIMMKPADQLGIHRTNKVRVLMSGLLFLWHATTAAQL